MTIEEVKDAVNEGLNISKENKAVDAYSLENLLHFTDENPDVEEVKRLVKESHIAVLTERYVMETEILINCPRGSDEYALAALFEKHKFMEDLFPYINVEKLFWGVLLAPNKQLFNFTEQLIKRYKVSNIGEFLHKDKIALRLLYDKLETHLESGLHRQPRGFLLQALLYTLKDVCDRLENTKNDL